MKRLLGILIVLAVAGCASKAKNIAASYVSPMHYSNMNCAQLAEEARTMSARAAEAAGVQDNKATKDAVITTAGIILFFPALFFTSGDGATAAEVARLKGEMQAIEDASRYKQCGIQFKKQ